MFPVANFYLLPSRIWELMAGALCAVIIEERKKNIVDQPLAPRQQLVYEVMSVVGLSCVVGSVLFMGSGAIRQTSEILVPVIGSVLIVLFCNSRTFVARLMSVHALVFVGRISYSAYLWHQPVFAFSRILMMDQISDSFALFLVGLSMLLGYIIPTAIRIDPHVPIPASRLI